MQCSCSHSCRRSWRACSVALRQNMVQMTQTSRCSCPSMLQRKQESDMEPAPVYAWTFVECKSKLLMENIMDGVIEQAEHMQVELPSRSSADRVDKQRWRGWQLRDVDHEHDHSGGSRALLKARRGFQPGHHTRATVAERKVDQGERFNAPAFLRARIRGCASDHCVCLVFVLQG